MSTAIALPTSPLARLALARDAWRILARDDQKAPPDFPNLPIQPSPECLGLMWAFAAMAWIDPPEPWRVWYIRSGRGAGKTRTGSEWIKSRVAAGARRIALIGKTAADVRDVMIEGNAGILSVYDPEDPMRPEYEPSKRRLSWPNGAVATAFAGGGVKTAPDQLRGPEHDTVWCDELAKFEYGPDCWDNAQMGCRIQTAKLVPQLLVTTTPRPLPFLSKIQDEPTTHLTVTSTYANRANLDRGTLRYLRNRYEGTRLGRQELHGEVLEDIEGAIVTREMIDAGRITHEQVPTLSLIAVGVDPAVSTGEESDSSGIVVTAAGPAPKGWKDDGRTHLYVLADTSGRFTPKQWAEGAIFGYHRWQADRIVAEVNNGGDLVEHTVSVYDPTVPVLKVNASRGKHIRFAPVGMFYEQGRAHHVGSFPELEDQICLFTIAGYEGGASPDNADAMVWSATYTAVRGGASMEDVLDVMESDPTPDEPEKPDPAPKPGADAAERLRRLFGTKEAA